MDKEFFSLQEVSNMLSISKERIKKWEINKKLVPIKHPTKKISVYHRDQLSGFEDVQLMLNTAWDQEMKVKPRRQYNSIELFAGCGGLALGLEKAGFEHILLNEIDKDACQTLKINRSDWNVVHQNVTELSFLKYRNKVDLITGGFPCQSFSYAGNKLGFEDTRGTLFFEFARAIKEASPKVFFAENVRGLLNHDNGKTLAVMKEVIASLGYTLVEPRVLKAIYYQVPQKRERLILIGIKNDYVDKVTFKYPSPYKKIMTLRDALKAGELYRSDVPSSIGQKYPERKREILSQVPQGGYWRDLPKDLQLEFMQKSYYLGGGKTGMARRLSWDEPSLTLTCAPAQKQTERCHPEETRPLTVREYARIQTFPDEWVFAGSQSSIYKQIGNAVPVNLAYAVGRSIVKLLNDIVKL
ncbi:MAG: DNA (cytosine-5-)-methyltransferase [Gammaproteobacteria bacterium]|nr:DNA (cytosine-5-)-methyltransferase [Gammaproteobacteria bacterium]